jgi:hypothetical protein
MAEVSHVETPKSYLWWSLIAAISGAVGANYHLRALKGALTYKPNLYVMLLGSSGLGKGFGINLSKLLVTKTDSTRVVAGRSSIQAIVSELSKQKTRADGKPAFEDSRGFIVNGELSSAIVADVDSLAILTDLYDGVYNPEWTNSLKTSGKEKLVNPYITALFGSSLAHFHDTIPAANIEGGYIGRNLLVYEEKRAQNVDLLDDSIEIDDKLKEYIIPHYSKHLMKLAGLKGQLIPTQAARESFNTWRMKWRNNPIPDKTGFVNRAPDHILKVAMCLALAEWENTDGAIELSQMEEAIEKVTNLIHTNKMATAGRGIDPLAAQGRMVIEIMLGKPEYKIFKKDLLAAGHGDFDLIALERIMDTYEQMGWVKSHIHKAGANSDKIYELQGTPVELYGRNKK